MFGALLLVADIFIVTVDIILYLMPQAVSFIAFSLSLAQTHKFDTSAMV